MGSRRKRRKKSKLIPVLSCVVFMTGVMIILYPVVSNYMARRQQEKVIVGYEQALSLLDNEKISDEWKKAKKYNLDYKNYMNVLNIEGNGVMGYIEIPKINARIPIYHYANEESLKKGVGHMEQTGLPIGGKNNHPVLTGHRGLPNAELFTRLDEIEIGDVFYISILDQILTYEVNQITIVLPEEIRHIEEKNNQDLVTLVTCTPYGVNTHRLLVTGERTEYVKEKYEEQEVEMPGRNKIIFYIIIMFTGVVLVLYPNLTNKAYNNKIQRQEKLYFHHVSSSVNMMEKLYKELVRRNEQLYQNSQKEFSNSDAYKKSTINLRLFGINNNTIGYITIPKMKVKLPIILGATEENMKKGAVHLTETSYPVGGNNSNCVIAAHRGYSKTAMFRNIDKLEIGDKIYIKNFKEELTYEVSELRIISPTDISQILIRDGKDMITLMTCHPYRKNHQRYVVFCERI